jgi:hypothetical protein
MNSVQIAVFLVVIPCSLVDGYRRFGGIYCLHFQVYSVKGEQSVGLYRQITRSLRLPVGVEKMKPREPHRNDKKNKALFSEPHYCLTGSWNREERRPNLGPQNCFLVQEGNGVLGKV